MYVHIMYCKYDKYDKLLLRFMFLMIFVCIISAKNLWLISIFPNCRVQGPLGDTLFLDAAADAVFSEEQMSRAELRKLQARHNVAPRLQILFRKT